MASYLDMYGGDLHSLVCVCVGVKQTSSCQRLHVWTFVLEPKLHGREKPSPCQSPTFNTLSRALIISPNTLGTARIWG